MFANTLGFACALLASIFWAGAILKSAPIHEQNSSAWVLWIAVGTCAVFWVGLSGWAFLRGRKTLATILFLVLPALGMIPFSMAKTIAVEAAKQKCSEGRGFYCELHFDLIFGAESESDIYGDRALEPLQSVARGCDAGRPASCDKVERGLDVLASYPKWCANPVGFCFEDGSESAPCQRFRATYPVCAADELDDSRHR